MKLLIIKMQQNVYINNFYSTTIAPGHYSPESMRSDNNPSYSFGIKCNTEKPNGNPGKLEYIRHFAQYISPFSDAHRKLQTLF